MWLLSCCGRETKIECFVVVAMSYQISSSFFLPPHKPNRTKVSAFIISSFSDAQTHTHTGWFNHEKRRSSREEDLILAKEELLWSLSFSIAFKKGQFRCLLRKMSECYLAFRKNQQIFVCGYNEWVRRRAPKRRRMRESEKKFSIINEK